MEETQVLGQGNPTPSLTSDTTSPFSIETFEQFFFLHLTTLLGRVLYLSSNWCCCVLESRKLCQHDARYLLCSWNFKETNYGKEVLVSTEHLYSVEIMCHRCFHWAWMDGCSVETTTTHYSTEHKKMKKDKCIKESASPPVYHLRASPPVHHLLSRSCWSRAPCRSSPPRASWRTSHSDTLTLLHSHTLLPSGAPSRLSGFNHCTKSWGWPPAYSFSATK